MDHNNNVIDFTVDPSLSSSTRPSPASQCHNRSSSCNQSAPHQERETDSDETSLREDGVRGNSNRRVTDQKECCDDADSLNRLISPKTESDATSPRAASEPQELIAVDEIRDDIEIIVDLYILLENTRWLFHCVLW
jgi:hypothetical protein